MAPLLRFPLCGIASSCVPFARCASIHFQRSSGRCESKYENGTGRFLLERKTTLRCRLDMFGCDDHSYATSVVNLPGSLKLSAIWMYWSQIVRLSAGSAKTGSALTLPSGWIVSETSL